MAITSYTTYDDVRAALGVSNDEIDDATLALELYEFNLISELEDVGANLASDYATVEAVVNKSAAQVKFRQSVRLFSTYAVARQLLASLPLFSPKDIGDGKAIMSRYASNPYSDVISQVKEQYDKFKTKLANSYAAYTSATAPVLTSRILFAGVVSAYDPVTGS